MDAHIHTLSPVDEMPDGTTLYECVECATVDLAVDAAVEARADAADAMCGGWDGYDPDDRDRPNGYWGSDWRPEPW